MPCYDAHADAFVIRIVYDGAARSGKTRTLHALASQLPVLRRSSVITPCAVNERTPFFDWLELDAGRIGHHAVRAHVLTVPGPFALAARRWCVLSLADAVVSVCDSATEALERSKLSLQFLHRALEHHARSSIPLAVQAHKQDLPHAQSPDALRTALKVPPETPVIAASAVSGEGVLPAYLRALFPALQALRVSIASHGVASLPHAHALTPESLLERVRSVDDTSASDDALQVVNELVSEEGEPGA